VKQHAHKFAFLNDQPILEQLLHFKQGDRLHIKFYLPQVHCSSCLYLLENLYKIHPGIISSKLNFAEKNLEVAYNKSETSAFDLALVLTKLGYEPYFSLSDLGKSKLKPKTENHRLFQLGVAGFAFGNIMLLSFPEYFAYGSDLDGLKPYFQWLSILLIIPVITYSSMEFYKLAWGGIKEKYLNIDLPIVLAMAITFFRSLYEIYHHIGPGYFDSLSGIVFFMLLGRTLQDRTYKSITFNRDFTSYFPISATVFERGKEIYKSLHRISVGDELIIHDQEVVPVDGLIAAGKATIDYSFVTGESHPVELNAGSWVYAGGRQLGSSVRILAQKTVSQSYLVSLWEKSTNQILQKKDPQSTNESNYVQKASMYFTLGVFSVASLAAIYWSVFNPAIVWTAVTAVLIVACPCALLLSVTFTHGHFLSLFAKNGLFVKGSKVLENLNQVNHLVFDKTGTITDSQNPHIDYVGFELQEGELDALASLAKESVHPYARLLSRYLNRVAVAIDDIENKLSAGITGVWDGIELKLGSSEFVELPNEQVFDHQEGSKIWVRIGDRVMGYFVFSSSVRENLASPIRELGQNYSMTVLSGDLKDDEGLMREIFPEKTNLLFEQKPHDKKRFIENLERSGKKTLMLGDGLNDAGALMSSSVGVAVTDDIGYFTPGADAIIEGKSLILLPKLLKMAAYMRNIIWFSFAVSVVYNIIGLSFAVQGKLNPIIAAILMPSSSISIVLITWLGSVLSARTLKLKL
jgi:Cu+-exporting ATPase